MPKYRIKSDILGVDFGIRTDEALTERDYFDILKTKVSPQKMLGVYRRNKDDEKVQSLATKALDNDFFDTGVGFATGFAEAGKSLGRGVKNMMVTNIAGTSRLLDASMQYGEPDESQRYDDLIEEGIKKAGQQLKGLSYASKRTDRTIEDDLSQALQFAGLSQEDENLKKRVIAEARRQDYAQTDATQAQAGVDALGMTTMLGAKLKQGLTSLGGDSKERKLRELDYLVDQDYITRTMERGAELGLALTGQEESLRDVRSGLVEPDRDVALLGSIPLDPTLAPSMLASGGMAFGRNLIARGAINKFGKQAAEESALRATIAQISDVANPTATQKALLKTAEKKLQAVNGSGKKLEQLVAKSEGIAKTKAIDLIQKGQGNSPFTARILQAIDKTPAPKAPFTNRMTGKILERAGISGEYLGRTIEFLQRLPEETLTTLFMRSGMDEQAAMSAARGTARTLQASAAAGVLTGGFSEFTPELENLGLALLLAPGGSSLLTRFGHDTAILGKQLQYAQSSLPLFQRIAQLDPADSSLTAVTLDRTSALTLPGTISGLAEGVFAKSRQFGPSPALKVPATALTRTGLGNTLTGAVNTAKTAIGATAIPGVIGYAIDGEAGAGGAIASSIPFIGAGLGLGTLARYGSKADIQAKMLGDESYYKDTYLNDADRVMYEGLKKPVRQALATSAIQNPDVIYKFIDKRGSSHWTVENGESVVTIYTKSAPQEQLSAVLGHEIAHHIDAFGFMPQILEQLVGSVEKGKPGIFTEYKNGKPVIIKDAEGRDVYATNKEFAKHRERYLDLLKQAGIDEKSPDYQAYANDDARIAREIFASHGAAWYFGGDFVTRNYQGAGAKMMGAILEPLFSSPGLRKFFHRIGLATQENTGLVADPLNLFPGLKEIPQLTRMIEKYNDDVRGFGPQARREGRGRGNLVDPAFADEIATVNLTAKDLENTAIVDRLKAGGVVKIKDDGTIETDAEGRPVFLPTREVNKKNKQLSNDILSIIRKKEDAGETFGEGHVALEKTADGRDRATGRFLDPSIIDELAQTGRYNPHQLAALKQISQTLRNDTGDVWNLFYYSALKYNKAGRKVYGQIKGGDRKSLPFGIEITKDGNINIQTISLEAFRKNLDWFAKSKGYEQKMAEAFQGMNAYENVQNAMKLLPTYLQNHMKGVINGSDGSGITPLQRDLINASIGRINADQVKANPILEGLGDRRSQRQQSIRSRRLDRIGNAIRGESGFPAFKSAIEQNKVPMYMPAAYHGTPHTFAAEPGAPLGRFRTSAIGTGEGAQAYGHGLYFAGRKEVAEFYKDSIPNTRVDGQPLNRRNPRHLAAVFLKDKKTPNKAIESLKETKIRLADNKYTTKEDKVLIDNAITVLKSDNLPKLKETKPSLYKVELAPKENEYLLWDKPLSEQPKGVREKIEKGSENFDDLVGYSSIQEMIDAGGLSRLFNNDGGSFYDTLSRDLGGQKASAILKEAGIPGIKYKIQEDRGKATGDYNYVIFDEADVQITDKLFMPASEAGAGKGKQAEAAKLWQEKGTDSPYFKKWFGKSKVVDENGEPLVVYHGTSDQFTAFDADRYQSINKGDFGEGFYFTPKKGQAKLYSQDAIKKTDPEVLALQKEYESQAKQLGTSTMMAAIDLGLNSPEYKKLQQFENRLDQKLQSINKGNNEIIIESYLSLQNPLLVKSTSMSDPFLAQSAKERGHDGIIVKFDNGTIDEIVAFSPEQIKSATGNRGTFDAGERNILFMPASEAADLDFKISTRNPTAKNATENPITEDLIINTASIADDATMLESHALALQEYPGIKKNSKVPKKIIDSFVDHVVDNLLYLHDQVRPEVRNRSKLWYDGARNITEKWNQKYGNDKQAIAAALASLSPQKDWFMNVDLARRMLDIYKDQSGFAFDKAMAKKYIQLFEKGVGKKKATEIAEAMVGKTLNELQSDFEQAAFIRSYDEVYNPREYQVVSPEGDFIGLAKSLDGVNKKVAWGSMTEISKAVKVLRNPSKESISTALGNAHKIRNFYNNILLPNADKFSVTIDTHAIAAALLRPLAGADLEVANNFGSKPKGAKRSIKNSSVKGISGTYGIYADAYRKAAEARGILPREMQSITWEAIRGLYEAKWKTKSNKAKIDNLWKKYENGELTLNETREQILESAGGITEPEWVTERSNSGADGTNESANKSQELYRPELGGSELRANPRRGRTNSRGSQEVNFLPAGNFSRQPANRITRQAPAMPGNRFMLPAASAGAKSAERFR